MGVSQPRIEAWNLKMEFIVNIKVDNPHEWPPMFFESAQFAVPTFSKLDFDIPSRVS